MRLRRIVKRRSRLAAMAISQSLVSREPWLLKFSDFSAGIMVTDSSAAAGGAKRKILVVDDHEDNVEVLRARLESRGYEVEGAMNGQAALDTVSRWCPDLVLLDVMMPDMDGFEVVRRLKADKS